MIRPVVAILLLIVLLNVLVVLTGSGSLNVLDPVYAEPAKTATVEPKEVAPELTAAGICARCHVVSVLEWGISGHVEAETNCQSCHGSSLGHVANERNEVKPDHLPRGDAIAKQLCADCHDGCPKTQEVHSCQTCHHVHGLVNPTNPPAIDDQLERLSVRWNQFLEAMDKGKRLVQDQNWQAARPAFREALKLIPGHRQARNRLEMCRRRLNPILPGFQIVGDTFDSSTGLPRDVTVDLLDLQMRLVPPGEFDIGSEDLKESRPSHNVRVNAFYLSRYELTQAQWASLLATNPSVHQAKDSEKAEQMPVEKISWNDAQEFLNQLNKRVKGGGFRLPSEAEWEYACRAGGRTSPKLKSSNASSQSANRLTDYAWMRDNSLLPGTPAGHYNIVITAFAPRPIGTKLANAWGFYDMQGNVSEWCSTQWRPYLYDHTDGRESPTRTGLRIVRGGSYADSADSLNPALRHAARPHRRFRWTGIRLARSVPGEGMNGEGTKVR